MMRYLEIVFLLVLVYIVVSNGSKTEGVIRALSNLNTNAITALQGRTGFASL